MSLFMLRSGAARVILVTAPKITRGGGNFYMSTIYASVWCRKSYPGHGTKNCKRMRLGTKSDQHKFMSIKFASAWRHETSQHQNCKRCPSTSLYEFRFV